MLDKGINEGIRKPWEQKIKPPHVLGFNNNDNFFKKFFIYTLLKLINFLKLCGII